jgi:hypothetical protein
LTYKEDPEKNRARSRAWRAANPDAARKNYLANREKRIQYAREYRDANPEKQRAANRAWKARNREKVRAYEREQRVTNGEAIRARFMHWTHGLRPEDWATLWDAQGGKCYLCGRELTQDKHTHVDHDHSHCAANRSCHICQRGLACKDCNTAIGLVGEDPARLRRMADALEAAHLAFEQRKAAAG